MATLREAFRAFPDSVTVWETQQVPDSGGSDTYAVPATALYFRAAGTSAPVFDPNQNCPPAGPYAMPSSASPTTTLTDTRTTFVLPLVSGGRMQTLVNHQAEQNASNTGVAPINIAAVRSLPLNDSKLAKQNFVNINALRAATDRQSGSAAV